MFGNKRKKYHLLADQELLQLYRETHKSIFFGIIYERYAYLVLGVCLKYVRDEAEAQDLCSKVFEELGEKIQKYSIENFKSWLYRLVKNECLQYFRKQKITFTREYEQLAQEDTPLDLIQKEKQLVQLEHALGNLKEQQQKCIRLFYLEGKSYTQIAAAEKLDLKHVKSAIQNGKRNLKLILIENDEFNEARSKEE